MPCDSSYLKPTQREEELQRAAILLKYVYEQRGVAVPREVIRSAADSYGGPFDCIPSLCEVLTSMMPSERDRLLEGKNRTARDLANWWEEHQEADRAKALREANARAQAGLRKSALGKLTPAEKKALGLKGQE